MEKVDSTFMKVKPAGKEGDWKCDGWLPKSGTCFQVYAPESLTSAQTITKITDDFEGAKARWGEDLKEWVFVFSSAQHGLPPQVVAHLQGLKGDNPTIEIDRWGREALWQKTKELSLEDRNDLFGPPPILREVTGATDAEVRTLLNYVRDQPIPNLDEDLGRVGIEDKMDRNELDESVRLLITASNPVVSTVEHYVSKNVDPRFSQRVATVLKEKYDEFRDHLDGDADAIFGALVNNVAGDYQPPTKEYWAAVAIIAYYFQLCDIFER